MFPIARHGAGTAWREHWRASKPRTETPLFQGSANGGSDPPLPPRRKLLNLKDKIEFDHSDLHRGALSVGTFKYDAIVIGRDFDNFYEFQSAAFR
jgi:hypothetical protein